VNVCEGVQCIVTHIFMLCVLRLPGHMGIANSDGVIFDFAGPYTINADSMTFGAPTRYLTLDPHKYVCE
jgi:hypothetical protein